MSISILIVNWNSKDYLRRCLQSIQRTCAEFSPQIIVVDNGSFDGCGEMLAAEFPEVEFVQSTENLGFGRANNLGFERVRGEALLLLNPDTELQPGALSTLFQALRRLPQVGILGPRILNTDGSLQTTGARNLPTPLNQALDSELLHRLFPDSCMWGPPGVHRATEPLEVECLSGACMLMHTEVFRRVGGFSPEFFMYGEDVDLCFKICQLGLRLYHIPSAVVIHHGGKSAANHVRKYPIVAMREADYEVIRKWRGLPSAVAYRLLQGISALFRLPLLLCWTMTRLSRGWWQAGGASVFKWWTILCWSVGLESRVAVSPQAQGIGSSELSESSELGAVVGSGK